ncbi:MAG: aminopeptidase N [Zoogloeaceae bacterium]|jgi:aminopeptidase N|nr:aminopeptidase N [Zoogloeaceae bacterium]
MKTDTPQTTFLKDYAPSVYRIETVALDVSFQREEAQTLVFVKAHLECVRAEDAPDNTQLKLDGEELETLEVRVNGKPHPYSIAGNRLILSNLPERFVLETRVRLHPDANTRLSGLYRSQSGYFTQCEAEGFRRITWFLDRPDIMAAYTVTLHADKAEFPVLLANGNLISAHDEENGRHCAVWRDPFPKPCYLFALVAARLDVRADTFITASGREVALAIYVELGKLDQCAHAMLALKKAMRWDEERFGLECDLERYMIVAVSDFNMGAMENKGLNIFNARYVLARPDIATDADFEGIDRVVAHEYFHNWTGNRVTCRDWFQLSLKEGLTVFRDQEFGADLHNPATARIREVRALRAIQFPEDAGPMAHPVRPASYMEINNFYTATVYEKGAEVVRMIETLIGRDTFCAGLHEYFRRHDGSAVTCDDFVAAMAAVSGFDFTQFMRWYELPGTPRVRVQGEYDAAARCYTLAFRQENPKAREVLQEKAGPQVIPVRVTLFDPEGHELPGMERTLILTEEEQSFRFENLATTPIPSLLRDFSAPVILESAASDADLACLMAHERDPFNAWEAGQRMATRIILEETAARVESRPATLDPEAFIAAARHLLQKALGSEDERPDAAFLAECLTLPGESTLAEHLAEVDPEALHTARNALRLALAQNLEGEFQMLYERLASQGEYRVDAREAGRRALRNLALGYLLELDTQDYRDLAYAQFRDADNMTDQFAALAVLCNVTRECPEREHALDGFYRAWQEEALVVDKWLSVQATSRRLDTLSVVRALSAHPAYDPGNPNKVYALLRGFGSNFARFNAADGEGYRFLAEQILVLDARNPQVAARLARAFDRWRRFDAPRQTQGRAALERLRSQPGLSRDVFEVVNRALGDV